MFLDIDGGEGYLSGTCSGGQLHITLYTTKPVALNQVQYAAAPRSAWPSGMITCTSECELSEDGQRVDVFVPGASGG